MKQKTLQEQYNLIKEGKGNAEVFVKDAKRQFPGFVRNAATLNETISSLKHNHIISESALGLGIVTTGNPNPDWFKIFNTNIEEAKAVEKETSKEVVDVQEKGFDYKDEKNIDNLFGEAFLEGYYTEMKDPKNADKSVDELKEIVAKNLAKDKLHYVKDGQFGEKGVGYTDELPGLKASKTDKMEKVPMNEGRINLLDIVEGYSEFQRDDKGSKDVAAKDKGEQDAYGAGVKKGEEIEKKKIKKESTESKLAEIEKAGKVFTLEAQINALEEIIESKTQRLSMISEDENLSELVDKKKIKELQKEVSLLEKKKLNLEKLYEKASGKKYQKKEVVDEGANSDSLKVGQVVKVKSNKTGLAPYEVEVVELKGDEFVGELQYTNTEITTTLGKDYVKGSKHTYSINDIAS